MMRLRAFALPLVLLLLSCGKTERPGSPCRTLTFEGAEFVDCIAEPALQNITLVLDGPDGEPLRGLAALKASRGPKDPPVAFAMNAGMFNEAGQPIGLYVEPGDERQQLNRRKGPGNFHLLPNGVFSIEADGWHLRTADGYAARTGPQPRYATQSGPMLVIGGKLHPKISPNGESRTVRNAVGLDAQGRAHFVISSAPVSFGVIARLYRDKLGCADALFLDGSVSALWDPASNRLDETGPLGPLVVVTNR